MQDAELHLEKGEGNKKYYQVEIPTPVVGLYWYYFVVITGGKVYYYGNNNERLGGEGLLREQVPPPFQITVYRDFTVPDWFSRSVMYQIFVDRFYNGNENGVVNNPKKGSLLHGCWDDTPIYIKEPETGAILRWDFFGGNLEGIIKKLPYLKELGVGVLYFNPIFESPSNHKYDTADYKKIDSMFGSNEDFRRLCQKRGSTTSALSWTECSAIREATAFISTRKAIIPVWGRTSRPVRPISVGTASTAIPMNTKAGGASGIYRTLMS